MDLHRYPPTTIQFLLCIQTVRIYIINVENTSIVVLKAKVVVV
jgi:hypothetical protein